MVFESPGLRRRVVSNRAVSVHALPLILSRLRALPITSYFRLPVPSLSGGGGDGRRGEVGERWGGGSRTLGPQ